LSGANTKSEDAAFSRILPNVMRHLRLLWQGRLCVDARCTPANAPESVRRQFLDKPNLLSEYTSRQNAILNSVRNLPLPQLARCFAVVADTDARLKGGLDAFSTQETLERMVLDMAQITSKSRKRQ
jgi:DNA polymerase III delta subunit